MERYLRNIEKEINKNYHGDIDYYCDKQQARADYIRAIYYEVGDMIDKYLNINDDISFLVLYSNLNYSLSCLLSEIGDIYCKLQYANSLKLHYLLNQAR